MMDGLSIMWRGSEGFHDSSWNARLPDLTRSEDVLWENQQLLLVVRTPERGGERRMIYILLKGSMQGKDE
jgi:hypothetical protein